MAKAKTCKGAVKRGASKLIKQKKRKSEKERERVLKYKQLKEESFAKAKEVGNINECEGNRVEDNTNVITAVCEEMQ